VGRRARKEQEVASPPSVTRQISAFAGDAAPAVDSVGDDREVGDGREVVRAEAGVGEGGLAGLSRQSCSSKARHSSIKMTADTYSHLIETVGAQAAEASRRLVLGGDEQTA
jgi:hypothetical protein